MRNWYQRVCTGVIRSPQRTNHGKVQGVKGAPRMSDKRSNDKHNPINNPINDKKAADRRLKASAEALAAFLDEHPGAGGSTTGAELQAKIDEVMNKVYQWDRAPFGQPPDLEAMTIEAAFLSGRYSIYIGTTKEWLVDMAKFNNLSDKSLFIEWLRCVYIGVLIWQQCSNSQPFFLCRFLTKRGKNKGKKKVGSVAGTSYGKNNPPLQFLNPSKGRKDG
jgi:hypothetical protein